MTYGELSYRAKKLYTKGKITISEYLEMTKPLNREIEQEPKTGHWIPIYQGDEIINYRCSECELGDTNGSTNLYGWDYCRRCGAKMEELQAESEEME